MKHLLPGKGSCRSRSLAAFLLRGIFFLFLTTPSVLNAQITPAPPANIPVPFVNGTYSVSIVTGNMPSHIPFVNIQPWTGNFGLPASVLFGSVTNQNDVVDANTSNYATLDGGGLLALLTGQRLTVQSNSGTIPAGYYVGFDISKAGIANLSLLGSLQIKTYNGNTLQETFTLTSELVGLDVLGSLPVRTGFVATQPFDRIMFEQEQFIGVNLGVTRIYNVVVEEFAAGAPLGCNAFTPQTWAQAAVPGYPVVVDNQNTGISGALCVACGITNTANAIDTVASTSTDLVVTVGALTSVTYGVRDVVTTYTSSPASPVFAGFEIANPGLVNLNIFNGVSISTTLNGVIQQTATAGSGLVSASLINGNGRQIVGFVPTGSFDGVMIELDGAINATLGTTQVFGAVFKQFCATNLDCNELTKVVTPTHPVYINGERTGITGAVGVGSISNTENIINGSASPATIEFLIAGLATASISVANALETYPAWSYAGFNISAPSLLTASLIGDGGIQIEFYNNGTLVHTSTGALLAGASLLVSADPQIIGATSPVAFDEARLVVSRNLATVNLGIIEVYGAYFQPACNRPLDCTIDGLLSNEIHGAVVNGDRSGIAGLSSLAIAPTLQDTWNAVTLSSSDNAVMNSLVGIAAANRLSITTPAYTYPVGSFAGFAAQSGGGLVNLAILGNDITITTYNNGVLAESKTGSAGGLLSLSLLSGSSNTSTIGFFATQPFDEVQITVGDLASVEVGYSLDIFGAYINSKAAYDPGNGVLCLLNNTVPDENTGLINLPISGSVSTNDDVPNPQYTQPAGPVSQPGGSSPTLTLNPNGTYTFMSDLPGTYVYETPVCAGLLTSGCPTRTLTIFLQDAALPNNPPMAYDDYAETKPNLPVIIRLKPNDQPGSLGGVLGGPAVIVQPSNGSAVVNGDGTVTYTPDPGFIGRDTLEYEICESPSGLCTSAFAIIRVKDPAAVNSTRAVNDHNIISQGQTATGNLLINDNDAEGDDQDVMLLDLNGDGIPETVPTGAPQDVYQGAVKVGTLTLNMETGEYSFIAEPGFIGTVNIGYQATDDDPVAPASSQATLVIIVKPGMTLPVSLESFNVIYRRESCSVLVTWKSETEANFSHFELERKVNEGAFEKISVIGASGTGSNYSFTDPSPARGLNIYRLRMVDLNGAIDYSLQASAMAACTIRDITVGPNPAHDIATVKGLTAGSQLKVYDVSGKLVMDNKAAGATHQLDISSFAKGLYLLQVIENGQLLQSIKLIRN